MSLRNATCLGSSLSLFQLKDWQFRGWEPVLRSLLQKFYLEFTLILIQFHFKPK